MLMQRIFHFKSGRRLPRPVSRPTEQSYSTSRNWSGWLLGLLSLLLVALGGGGCKKDGDAPAPAATTAPAAPPAGFTSKMATVNGVTLHYVIGGTGEPLVLLHGWPQTWYEWNRVMPQLAQKYTVIVPDMRGAGESARPQPATGYDKKTLAQDIYQLTQQLGYQRIRLVGHDIGLMVAYAYAAQYPAGVQKLVLMDAPLPGVEPVWSQFKANPQAWHFWFHDEKPLPEDLTAGREREYLNDFYTKFAYTGQSPLTAEETDEFVRAYAQPGGMSAGFEYYRAVAQDEKDNLVFSKTKLPMPVLVMGGEASLGPLAGQLGQAIATNATAVVIPKCGHWITEEQPAFFLNQLNTFL